MRIWYGALLHLEHRVWNAFSALSIAFIVFISALKTHPTTTFTFAKKQVCLAFFSKLEMTLCIGGHDLGVGVTPCSTSCFYLHAYLSSFLFFISSPTKVWKVFFIIIITSLKKMLQNKEFNLRACFLIPPNGTKKMCAWQRPVCSDHIGCNNLDDHGN